GGGLELLDQSWRGLGWGPLATGMAVLVSAVVIGSLLDLPFTVYETFVLEERFGFNRTTPGLFVVDLARNLAVSLALGLPLAWVVLWLMQAGGGLWWLHVWLVWTGFSLLLVWAWPAFIAPLFNRFSPLGDQALKQRIEALLARCGFSSQGVFVMDGSRRSAHGNAYFTGTGNNKRIVFFDTLLDTLDGDQIEAVLAHELGHFRRHHVRTRLLTVFAASLLGLALLGWLIQQPWFFHGLGVSTPSNHAALLLFMFTAPVFTVFLRPLGSWLSRRHEFEADEYAARQSDAAALIQALVRLYRDNASTLTPDPLYSAFYDSHPPAAVRVAHLQRLATAAPAGG
ncbi:MAG: M48 family metallopeptidase, partial [Pseudomonadota bacterium]|nr:M48 family metallopeptidase [Pseudomonadota bacterium]